jgi:DNA-binding Lrp family transcriptional regulator
MANYASRTGILWYAQSTIAEQCELSVDTLQRRIAELETDGFLTKTERQHQNGKKGGRYFYRLMMLAETPTIGYGEPDEAEAFMAESMPQIAVSFIKTTPQPDLNLTANSEEPYRTPAVLNATLNPSLDKPSKKNSGLAPVDDWPEDHFELFWEKYPPGRKTSKKAVREKLAKIRKRGVSFAAIMAGVARYVATAPEPKYTKAPEAWLNQECWDGEAPAGPNGGGPRKPTAFEIANGKFRSDQ